MLQELITALGYPVEQLSGGKVHVAQADLEVVVGELSDLVDKLPAWGWRYLRNVLNDDQAASGKLTQAIMAWGAIIDGVPAIWANTEDVTVRAKPGQLHPGAVVLPSSLRCGYSGCRAAFVPNVPWQRHCSREHQVLASKEKRRNE